MKRMEEGEKGGRGQVDIRQEKLPSKRPALLELNDIGLVSFIIPL